MNFVKEHYIELKGLSPYYQGRIVISVNGQLFNSEIDIVQSESGKIYNHVEMIYNREDPRELLDYSVFRLSEFLKAKAK